VDGGLEELAIPERLTWVPEGVPRPIPLNIAQMYRRLSEAIRDNVDPSPSFDLAVERHRLLDTIQGSSDQGMNQKVSPVGA
jgi:predicted dehydrogenase